MFKLRVLGFKVFKLTGDFVLCLFFAAKVDISEGTCSKFLVDLPLVVYDFDLISHLTGVNA